MTETADPLAHVLRRTTAAMRLIGPPDNVPWLFSRCWLSVTRFEEHGRDLADLDRALTDFDELPEDLPGRAKLASVLLVTSMRAQLFRDTDRLTVARRLVEIANADAHPLPDWPSNHAAVRSLILQHDAMNGAPGFQLRAALAELDRHAVTVGDEQPYEAMVGAARIAVRHLISQQDNNLGEARGLPEEAAEVFSSVPPGSPGHGRAGLLPRLLTIQSAALRGDLAAVAKNFDQLTAELAALPATDPGRVAFERATASLGPMMEMMRRGQFSEWSSTPGAPGTTDPMLAEQIRLLREMADLPHMSTTERAMRLGTLGATETGSDDASVVADGVEHLAEAIRIAEPHDPRLPFYRMSSGVALARRWELTGDRADLLAAIDDLEAARADAGSVAHAYWTMASMPLAHAYRNSGRRDHGRRVALSGLRGHAWNVLLQGSVDDMHAAARHAAGDAVDVARWCLSDNDPESAAAALEAGRCLIVHSAVETRDVDGRLRALGHDRLAQQWRHAVTTTGPTEAPAELRRRVVGAVTGVELDDHGGMSTSLDSGAVRLLDPPSVHETRAALSRLGADALVYLVPGENRDGAAVVVSGQDTTWMLLPGMTTSALREFTGYLGEAARSATEPAEDARRTREHGRATVSAVCRWAWDTAIGPLLTRHLAVPADRPVRLVLVPMGELARVPWHAAHRAVGDRTEYALEHAVFSYAPSARLLCDSAWGKDVELTDHGLVVGDPDTGGAARNLPSARAEALAIRRTYYAAARYVGRDAAGGPAEQGRGDRTDLLDWLGDPSGGPMAHLACHGVVRAGEDGPHSSYLLLADNQRLAAEELVSTLAAAPDRVLRLAVLAACDSGASGRGYDEAFSLATAFLARRTQSVVSALWSVPDAPTSVLMFLFHHYLRVGGMPAADALRAAQLWLLGDEPPPEQMPQDLRARAVRRAARDISAWAGFVHFGR